MKFVQFVQIMAQTYFVIKSWLNCLENDIQPNFSFISWDNAFLVNLVTNQNERKTVTKTTKEKFDPVVPQPVREKS